jgi:hypothetical protein
LKIDVVYRRLKSAILRILQTGTQSRKVWVLMREGSGNLLDNPSRCEKLRPDGRRLEVSAQKPAGEGQL